jgi:hypothetical protein
MLDSNRTKKRYKRMRKREVKKSRKRGYYRMRRGGTVCSRNSRSATCANDTLKTPFAGYRQMVNNLNSIKHQSRRH